MVGFIYSPIWFYGKDIIIDFVSVFVLFLIAFFSLKYYRINKKNKNYLCFASSFGLIMLSFFFKIITNFVLYYNVVKTMRVGFFTFTYHTVELSHFLYSGGILFYHVFMLLGLFMLYSIYLKNNLFNSILIVYFILILTYFSVFAYYAFHLTALIFLIIITLQYWKNYVHSKYETNKLLFYSFNLIAISQILFIFIEFNLLFYVIAEIIQLFGYVGLLITFIKVLKNGKKKRKK